MPFADSPSSQRLFALVMRGISHTSIGVQPVLVEMPNESVAFVGIAGLAALGVWQCVADESRL